jgi:ABC-type glycerol-3-phosphate transport system substrate-binding protein
MFLKKGLVLLLVVVLLAAALPKTQAQDVVKITYWDYWVTQGTAVDEAIKAFEAAHPNIEVEKTTQGGGTYDQLVQAAFTAGKESTPDVFVLPGNPTFPEMLEANWLMPLNGMAGFQEWYDAVPNTAFVHMEGAGNTVDGNVYSSQFWSNNVWIKMFVNTKVYANAGLSEADFPTTLDQLIENSRIIRENTDAYGVGFSGTQGWAAGWWMWMCQFSTQMYTFAPFPGWNWMDGKYDISTDECANAALEGLLTLRDDDLLHPETVAMAIDDEAARVLFAENQFAHLIAGNWVIGGWASTNPDFKDFRIIALPVAGVAEPGGSFNSAPGARWFGISSDTEHPEESWEFFKFLHSPEFASIWIQYADEPLYQMDPVEYATTPIRADSVALDGRVIPGPSIGVRNPDVAKVTFTLQGPSMDDIVLGLLSGQLDSVPDALKDIESRYQAAFDQGLADAQAAGLNVKLEDYIVSDWVPTQPYVQQ